MKIALITGVTGQDGSYLAELLLAKGYQVHGLQRRSSSENTTRIQHLIHAPNQKNFHLHYGDLTDTSNIIGLIQKIKPHEIYNLGAQSHVHVSFDTAEYTANVDGLGALRILEAIKILELQDKTKFYQASSSELFGNSPISPQDETTPFKPCSPYATAKLYAYWATVNYREAYGIHASNGILFNHESPRRGEDFVTRKITRAVAAIHTGKQEYLSLGNLDSKRDWGHAADYIEGIWRIVQHDTPDDFVLATGQSHSVRDFVEAAFIAIGDAIIWQGTGLNEKGVSKKTEKTVVQIDPEFFRPNDIAHLIGNPDKAKKVLNWDTKISFKDLVKEMVEHDLSLEQ